MSDIQPRRDGVKPEGGGQPHRVRKAGPGRDSRPTPERAFDPLFVPVLLRSVGFAAATVVL